MPQHSHHSGSTPLFASGTILLLSFRADIPLFTLAMLPLSFLGNFLDRVADVARTPDLIVSGWLK